MGMAIERIETLMGTVTGVWQKWRSFKIALDREYAYGFGECPYFKGDEAVIPFNWKEFPDGNRIRIIVMRLLPTKEEVLRRPLPQQEVKTTTLEDLLAVAEQYGLTAESFKPKPFDKSSKEA